MEIKWTQTNKNYLEQRTKIEGFILPDLKSSQCNRHIGIMIDMATKENLV